MRSVYIVSLFFLSLSGGPLEWTVDDYQKAGYLELDSYERPIFHENHAALLKQAHGQEDMVKDAILLIHRLAVIKERKRLVAIGSAELKLCIVREMQEAEMAMLHDETNAISACNPIIPQSSQKEQSLQKFDGAVRRYLVAHYARWLHDAAVLQLRVEELHNKAKIK